MRRVWIESSAFFTRSERVGKASNSLACKEWFLSGKQNALPAWQSMPSYRDYVGDGEEGDRERGGMKDSGVPNGRLST